MTDDFWRSFYEDLASILFTEKSYVFSSIIRSPKKSRDIVEEVSKYGLKRPTVHKYLRWGLKKGYIKIADKEVVNGRFLANVYVTTFYPTIESLAYEGITPIIYLDIVFSEEFCENVCKSNCNSGRRSRLVCFKGNRYFQELKSCETK